jgi:hypothetical protein
MYTSITAGQVLQSKGQGFLAIGPDMLAYDALEIISNKNVGHCWSWKTQETVIEELKNHIGGNEYKALRSGPCYA